MRRRPAAAAKGVRRGFARVAKRQKTKDGGGRVASSSSAVEFTLVEVAILWGLDGEQLCVKAELSTEAPRGEEAIANARDVICLKLAIWQAKFPAQLPFKDLTIVERLKLSAWMSLSGAGSDQVHVMIDSDARLRDHVFPSQKVASGRMRADSVPRPAIQVLLQIPPDAMYQAAITAESESLVRFLHSGLGIQCDASAAGYRPILDEAFGIDAEANPNKMVRALLDAGADVLQGHPLGHAAMLEPDDVGLVKRLLEMGAGCRSAGEPEGRGRYRLLEGVRACMVFGRLPMLRFLIEDGATIVGEPDTVNALDPLGHRPLHWLAAGHGIINLESVARLLLESKANPQLKNEVGESPLDVAKRTEREQEWNRGVRLLRKMLQQSERQC